MSVFKVFLVRVWENTGQKNSEYGQFLPSDIWCELILPRKLSLMLIDIPLEWKACYLHALINFLPALAFFLKTNIWTGAFSKSSLWFLAVNILFTKRYILDASQSSEDTSEIISDSSGSVKKENVIMMWLTHFQPMFHLCTPEKIGKHAVFWCLQRV